MYTYKQTTHCAQHMYTLDSKPYYGLDVSTLYVGMTWKTVASINVLAVT